MSRAAALVAACITLVALVGWRAAPDGVEAAGEPVTLALVAQDFTVSTGEPWRATFAVSGDLAAAVPTTTTTAPISATVPTAAPTVPATPPPAVAPAPPAPPVTTARILVRRAVVEPLALGAAFDGESGGTVAEAEVPVTLTTTADQTTFALEVPTADTAASGVLALDETGLHPVDVELLLDGTVVASSRTFVDHPPATPPIDLGPTRVAVVADVTDPGPNATPAALAAARAELRVLIESAGALGGTMTVRIPGPVAADLATTTPTLLAELRAAFVDVELLGRPSPELDPSSAVTSGLQDAFSQDLRTGEDLLTTSLALAPPARSAWLVDDPVSTPAAAMLREPLGYDALVFDRRTYDELDGSIRGFHDPSLAMRVEIGDDLTLPGFVHSGASTWLDRDELDRRGLTPADGAVRAMATLLVHQQLDPSLSRGAVLGLPTGVAPDPEVAATLAGYVAGTAGFSITRLVTLATSTDVMRIPGRGPEVVRLPDTAGVDLAPRAAAVDQAAASAAAASSMLPDDAQGEAWLASLDALLSTAVTDVQATAEIARVEREVQTLFAAVELPRPFTFTLTGRESSLPLRILNHSTDPLRVLVQPSSPKLRFPGGDVEVELAPSTYTDVTIPVEARTNGTSAISIVLLTPSGAVAVQGPVVLTARVNALSGLGQVVTGGAVLVLVSWWYGHFRRRRRARRALLGEVDNPLVAATEALSPDAAEAVAGNRERPDGAG